MTHLVNRLPMAVKISPDMVRFFEEAAKTNKEIHVEEIKAIYKDDDRKWSTDIINFIKDKSIELYEEDLSKRFEVAKTSSEITVINENGKPINDAKLNSALQITSIKMDWDNAFVSPEEFINLVKLLKLVRKIKELKAKVSFNFNNNLTVDYIFSRENDKMLEYSREAQDWFKRTNTNHSDLDNQLEYLNNLFKL